MPRRSKRYEWKPTFKRPSKRKSTGLAGASGLTSALRPAPNIDRRHGLDDQKWIDSGRWVYGKSSNVGGLMYDKEQAKLFVQFNSGGVYYYLNVPERVAKNFFNASSLGKFLHYHIKGKFAHAGPFPMSVSYR